MSEFDGPAFLYNLTSTAKTQCVIGDIVRNNRAGAYECALTDGDGSHERGIRPDEGSLADFGPVFAETVVIARDRARADIRLGADAGVAKIGQVAHLGAGPEF